MRKEYDFRFIGLRALDSRDAENSRRVKKVRSALLKIAGGFTEINPGLCFELMPGEGMGYIVALESKRELRALNSVLRLLAKEFGVAPPTPYEAASGPRREYSLILIPELANPAPGLKGYRRPLFRALRWLQIQEAFRRIKTVSIERVHGQWIPARGAKTPRQDDSRMFIIREASAAVERHLIRLIRTHVFDKGIECDQEFIYLSCGGTPTLVSEK